MFRISKHSRAPVSTGMLSCFRIMTALFIVMTVALAGTLPAHAEDGKQTITAENGKHKIWKTNIKLYSKELAESLYEFGNDLNHFLRGEAIEAKEQNRLPDFTNIKEAIGAKKSDLLRKFTSRNGDFRTPAGYKSRQEAKHDFEAANDFLDGLWHKTKRLEEKFAREMRTDGTIDFVHPYYGLTHHSFGSRNSCLSHTDLQLSSLGEKPSFAESVGSSLGKKMMGSMFGGKGLSFGLGSGGKKKMSDSPDKTYISPNPLEKSLSPEFSFSDGSSIQIQMQPSVHQPGPKIDADDIFGGVSRTLPPKQLGTLLGVKINRAENKDSQQIFADAKLIGPDCREYGPTGRLIFEVWQEISFNWSIEYWRWRNDVLQEHWLKTGSGSWEELLGKGDIPIWIGMRFDDVTPQMLAGGGWSLITGWTFEQDGKVMLQPRQFDLLSGSTPGMRLDPVVRVDPGAGEDPVIRLDLVAGVYPVTEADTAIQVGDDAVVIGGLIDSTETADEKIPMLGDIPHVGKLFQGKGHDSSKDELLIFVTPRIINEIAE